MSADKRTIQLNPDDEVEVLVPSGAKVTIITMDDTREVDPGITVAEALNAAGIEVQSDEVVRVNKQACSDADLTLDAGDVLSVVPRVRAG